VTGSTSFSIVRFLLGVAEAGFFPGLILYFTYWFPSHHHARIVSGFLIGLPFAVAVGSPISTGLLGLDGLFGLKGWQIMYIAEAIPTVVIGFITFFVLTDRPEQAKFLTEEERDWLVNTIAAERRATEAVRKFTLWQALYNPKVLLLALKRHRHGGVGAHLRSHERAALESVRRLRVRDRWPDYRRHDDGQLVGAGGNVDRRNGLLRLQGPVLRDAADVP
jgi:MFS family permease